jgi:16S rRNA processing protein RimM
VAQGVVTSAASESAALAANAVAHRVVAVRSQGSNLVAQLGSIDDRDVAEGMRGMSICVSRSTFPKADDDEYYWIDLIGCRLYGDRDGASVLIGEVAEVVDNGAHGVLKVTTGALTEDGAVFEPTLDPKGRPVETLVPFVGAHIQNVDLEARRIDSDWPVDF